jgi:hypothetical protein
MRCVRLQASGEQTTLYKRFGSAARTSVGGQSQLSDFEALLPVEKDATARALDRCRRLSGEIAHSLEIIPKRWVDAKILAELCASLEMAAEILQSTEERR